MKDKSRKKKNTSKTSPDPVAREKSFAEELGVVDLGDPILASHGRIFSVAGPDHPVAEFTDEFLVMHPADKPYQEEDKSPSEDIVFKMDNRGVILNEIGEPKKIPGAKFNGREIFVYYKLRPGSLFHYVVFFDDANKPNFLTVRGHRLTTELVYKLRNMTHNGDLTFYPDMNFELDTEAF